MDFRIGHLRHFIVLIEEGNFARAAERLCITQPTLSRSMQSLENKLEAQLLDRSGRTVTATPIGDALAGYAREILKQSEQAVNDIGLLAGRQIGHLRIGVGPYPASISVASAVARFVTSFPGISMNVDVADWNVMVTKVLASEYDLAVFDLDAGELDERLAIEPLPERQGHYFCRAGHPLASLQTVTEKDISRYPLAMTSLPRRAEHVATRQAVPKSEKNRTRRAPWIHVNSFDLARRIVLESDLLGLAVRQQIDDEIKAGLLTTLPFQAPGLHTKYGIVTRAKRTLSPAANAFIETLMEVEQVL